MSGYVRTSYDERPFTHPLAQQIAGLMEKKQSNICLAADVKSMSELLRIADLVGQSIVILKTHVDTYHDFDKGKLGQLQKLAEKHDFILFEDRKFLDIGNTVTMQYGGGVFNIANWAPLTNATIAAGPDILAALKQTAKKTNGVLLLAEMSSKGNTFEQFLPQTIAAAEANRDLVIGYISQRSFGNPAFLYMTPGVNALQKDDALGQTYRTPQDVIAESGSDVLIIGRGIYEHANPAVAAREYQVAAWKAHTAALGKFIGTKSQFIHTLLAANTLLFGEFKLKSGRISPYFCNCGMLTSGRDMAKTGEELARIIRESGVKFDLLFGTPYKGIPFVTATSFGFHSLYKENVPFAFNRKEVKTIGDGGLIVGPSLKGKRVFIIDDVITAGTAIKESIDIVQKEGGIPVGVALIFDRQEMPDNSKLSAVQQASKDYSIPIVCALKARDVFEFVKNTPQFQLHAANMEQYLKRYGAKL